MIEKLCFCVLGPMFVCSNTYMTENRVHLDWMMCAGCYEIVERLHLRTKNTTERAEKYWKLCVPGGIRNNHENALSFQMERREGLLTKSVNPFFHLLAWNLAVPDDHTLPMLYRFQPENRSTSAVPPK